MPKQGYTFSGWGVSNWGHVFHIVFTTKREAIKYCVEHAAAGHTTWRQTKKYYKIFRVSCKIEYDEKGKNMG